MPFVFIYYFIHINITLRPGITFCVSHKELNQTRYTLRGSWLPSHRQWLLTIRWIVTHAFVALSQKEKKIQLRTDILQIFWISFYPSTYLQTYSYIFVSTRHRRYYVWNRNNPSKWVLFYTNIFSITKAICYVLLHFYRRTIAGCNDTTTQLWEILRQSQHQHIKLHLILNRISTL